MGRSLLVWRAMRARYLFVPGLILTLALGCGATESGDTASSSDNGTSTTAGSGTGGGSSTTGTSGGGVDGSLYCPGYEPVEPLELARCSTDADCPTDDGWLMCLFDAPVYSCGPTQFQECSDDSDCGEDVVCEFDSCQNSTCVPACSNAVPCGDGQVCESGHCRAERCDDAGAEPCPEPTVCDPGGASDAYGCSLQHCSQGFECPPGFDCREGISAGQGCVQRPCTSDADCDCGACVNSLCSPKPKLCFPYTPPPVCAAPDTPIATPRGERPIASLRAGDLVYSVDEAQIVAVPLERAYSRPVTHHHVIEVVLEGDRRLLISAGHPTADGRHFGDLVRGGTLDGVPIVSARRVPYPYSFTYDILPRSSTGTYFAAGALIGSTLSR